MLKFTAEQLTAMGCKTHEELAAKLPALFSMQSTLEGFQAKIDSLSEKLTESETALANSNKEISTLKTSVLSPEKAKLIAREEATLVLGAAAIPPHQAAPPNPGTAVPGTKSESETLIAQGKFAEAWAVSPELKKEFGSAERYAAFMNNTGNFAVLNTDKKDK